MLENNCERELKEKVEHIESFTPSCGSQAELQEVWQRKTESDCPENAQLQQCDFMMKQLYNNRGETPNG